MNALNLPKLCGGDIELCNFFTGVSAFAGTGIRAALALLKKIEGVPGRERSYGAREYESRSSAGEGFDLQDWLRTYLPGNGGCVYIDLDHLEVCLPEVLSARDHVAAWHALLRIAARAQSAVNAELPRGEKVHVLANNSDGHGNSYGSHLDFLITRRAWDNVFYRRLQYLLFLAAYQVSSIVFAGQGKAGAENGAPPCNYQLSQRADFIEVLMGVQTTFNRPIVNSRDEPLCGREWGARLHCIFYDSTLCHGASFLKIGALQIILAMIEAEQVNAQLIVEDPVGAVRAWSRDPLLATRARMVSGKELTAVELQLLFVEEAKAFVDRGGCEGIVPEAGKIVELWADTLLKLKARDFPALAPRLDWVLKLSIVERAMKQRPELNWESASVKHLDHQYSALDGGLFQTYERSGAVERIVSDADIAHFVNEPPENTRAWARSRLLRLGEAEGCIESVDWDEIVFRLKHVWPSRRIVSLANPLGFTKANTRFLETATLDDALDVLGAQPAPVLDPAPVSEPRLATFPSRQTNTYGYD